MLMRSGLWTGGGGGGGEIGRLTLPENIYISMLVVSGADRTRFLEFLVSEEESMIRDPSHRDKTLDQLMFLFDGHPVKVLLSSLFLTLKETFSLYPFLQTSERFVWGKEGFEWSCSAWLVFRETSSDRTRER